MPKPLLVLLCALFPLAAQAAAIGPPDAGTYAIVRGDGAHAGLQLRLLQRDGQWLAEGKDRDGPWKNISCERGCEYRASTEAEAAGFLAAFPARMRDKYDIACIQNKANAFCRLTNKLDPAAGGYALVALVTGKPVPMPLQRLPASSAP